MQRQFEPLVEPAGSVFLYTFFDSIDCILPRHTIITPWNKEGSKPKHT